MDRETLILALAASAVALPLLVGVASGKIPKEVLLRWGLPLAGFTFILSIGARLVERLVPSPWNFVLQFSFGAVCLIAGVTTAFLRRPSADGKGPPLEVRRMLGGLLSLFGLLWLGISLFRFLRT